MTSHPSSVFAVAAAFASVGSLPLLGFVFTGFLPAAVVDRAIAQREAVGPLAGVPYGIKDPICTKDVRTMSGAVAFADFVPDEDDVVVERRRDAAAIAIGKTHVPEFGYSGAGHHPIGETTRNPWNLDRPPGGSSAGSSATWAAWSRRRTPAGRMRMARSGAWSRPRAT